MYESRLLILLFFAPACISDRCPTARRQAVVILPFLQTRQSLGYAYVNFQSAADAQKAIDALNYQPVKGRPCRIMWSQRDPSLRRSNLGNIFIKNLGPEITSRELNETFKAFGSILSCKVSLDPKGVSKGYGFVHFDTEQAAKDALESVNGMEFGGRVVEVSAYLPRPMRNTAERWTNLFVKNIPKPWTKKNVDELFAPYGEIYSSTVATDENGVSKGFGYVCFKQHESASKAVDALNGRDIESLPGAPKAEPAPAKDGEAARPVKFFVGRHQKKAERERVLKDKVEAAKRERAQKWAGCNLYVRNLDESIDDEKLRSEFAAHGTIVSAKVSRDAEGRSRGFGFVCFSAPEEASKGREVMHRKMLQGKPLFVTLWESKDSRTARLSQSAARFARGQQQGGAVNANVNAGMAGMAGAGGMNPALMMMQPQMLASALFANVAQNPQMAAIMRAMTPDAMASMMAAYVQNITAAMMRMPMQNQAGAPGARGPAGAPRVGQQQQAAGFPGFNPMQAAFAAMANPQAAAMQQAAAMGQVNGQAQQQRQPRAGGRPGQQQPAAGSPQTAPGGARVAAGPAGKQAPAGATAGGRPAAAGQPARGPAPAGAAARPAQAAPMAGQTMAQQVQFQANVQARNMPGVQAQMPMVPIPAELVQQVTAAMPAPVAAQPPAGAARQDFLSQLAAATPQQRKNLIGEQLYGQIQTKQPQLAGKITGMLLDGMEDSELIHLLESPAELDARIREAIEVLEQHKKQTEA